MRKKNCLNEQIQINQKISFKMSKKIVKMSNKTNLNKAKNSSNKQKK